MKKNEKSFKFWIFKIVIKSVTSSMFHVISFTFAMEGKRFRAFRRRVKKGRMV